jgi:hypothetical protein
MGIRHGAGELCFINPALAGRLPSDDAQAWQALCGSWGFPLWGGGKTWVAPEADWPEGAPQRDLDSGAYAVLESWCDDVSMGIELQSGICRQSHLQIRRRIEVPFGGSAWTMTHTLTNCGAAAHLCGIWDVLMLRRPAQVHFTREQGSTSDWRGAVHPVPGKGPIDDIFATDIVTGGDGDLQVRCVEAVEYKIGIDSDSGEVMADLTLPEGQFCYRRNSLIHAGARYAHGHPLEVFNSPILPYFEIETHSPLALISPGQSIIYTVHEEVAAIDIGRSRVP